MIVRSKDYSSIRKALQEKTSAEALQYDIVNQGIANKSLELSKTYNDKAMALNKASNVYNLISGTIKGAASVVSSIAQYKQTKQDEAKNLTETKNANAYASLVNNTTAQLNELNTQAVTKNWATFDSKTGATVYSPEYTEKKKKILENVEKNLPQNTEKTDYKSAFNSWFAVTQGGFENSLTQELYQQDVAKTQTLYNNNIDTEIGNYSSANVDSFITNPKEYKADYSTMDNITALVSLPENQKAVLNASNHIEADKKLVTNSVLQIANNGGDLTGFLDSINKQVMPSGFQINDKVISDLKDVYNSAVNANKKQAINIATNMMQNNPKATASELIDSINSNDNVMFKSPAEKQMAVEAVQSAYRAKNFELVAQTQAKLVDCLDATSCETLEEEFRAHKIDFDNIGDTSYTAVLSAIIQKKNAYAEAELKTAESIGTAITEVVGSASISDIYDNLGKQADNIVNNSNELLGGAKNSAEVSSIISQAETELDVQGRTYLASINPYFSALASMDDASYSNTIFASDSQGQYSLISEDAYNDFISNNPESSFAKNNIGYNDIRNYEDSKFIVNKALLAKSQKLYKNAITKYVEPKMEEWGLTANMENYNANIQTLLYGFEFNKKSVSDVKKDSKNATAVANIDNEVRRITKSANDSLISAVLSGQINSRDTAENYIKTLNSKLTDATWVNLVNQKTNTDPYDISSAIVTNQNLINSNAYGQELFKDTNGEIRFTSQGIKDEFDIVSSLNRDVVNAQLLPDGFKIEDKKFTPYADSEGIYPTAIFTATSQDPKVKKQIVVGLDPTHDSINIGYGASSAQTVYARDIIDGKNGDWYSLGKVTPVSRTEVKETQNTGSGADFNSASREEAIGKATKVAVPGNEYFNKVLPELNKAKTQIMNDVRQKKYTVPLSVDRNGAKVYSNRTIVNTAYQKGYITKEQWQAAHDYYNAYNDIFEE